MSKRLVYLCDWLPPDFGAVGQYAVLFARQWANEGWSVTLVGLTSGQSRRETRVQVGDGWLEVLRIHRRPYQKQKFIARLLWTIGSNLLLLGAALQPMRRADALLFTGSPPLMVHFIAPLNLLLRKQLIYQDHRLPSGVPRRRTWKQRCHFAPAAASDSILAATGRPL